MITLDNLKTILNAIKYTIDNTKQDKLIAGDNITIAADGKTVSAIVDGISVAMRVNGGYIQYSTDNGNTWNNLIPEADLKGDKGDPGTPGKDGHQVRQDNDNQRGRHSHCYGRGWHGRRSWRCGYSGQGRH